MSALPPKADIRQPIEDVYFAPVADIRSRGCWGNQHSRRR
jgi:hypothetical protein